MNVSQSSVIELAWVRLVLAGLASASLACRAQETRATATPASPVATAAPASSSIDPQRLVGEWMRADREYMIDISAVSPDGKLQARYLNPHEIHVSKAEWSQESGKLTILVEMQDRNYPGSYYTLSYDPGSDGLAGVYHHLGLNQNFDVAFARLEPEEEAKKKAK